MKLFELLTAFFMCLACFVQAYEQALPPVDSGVSVSEYGYDFKIPESWRKTPTKAPFAVKYSSSEKVKVGGLELGCSVRVRVVPCPKTTIEEFKQQIDGLTKKSTEEITKTLRSQEGYDDSSPEIRELNRFSSAVKTVGDRKYLFVEASTGLNFGEDLVIMKTLTQFHLTEDKLYIFSVQAPLEIFQKRELQLRGIFKSVTFKSNLERE